MRTSVVMTDEEWTSYKDSFSVGKMLHRPMVPPSYPVLVISQVLPTEYFGRPGSGVQSMTAHHSFVEASALKKMLGLP